MISKRHILTFVATFIVALGGAAVASDFSYTVPTAGTTPGPTWASQIATALTLLKSHTHTGSTTEGPQLGAAALNIDGDVSFNSSYAATGLQHTTYVSQASAANVANLSAYVKSNNLYYKNSSGTEVQLTNGSSAVGGTDIFGTYHTGTSTSGTIYHDPTDEAYVFFEHGTTPTYTASNVLTGTTNLEQVAATSLVVPNLTDGGFFIYRGGARDLFIGADNDQDMTPAYTSDQHEASAIIALRARREASSTYYGATVDVDHGHVGIGTSSPFTVLADGKITDRLSADASCDESTQDCEYLPLLTVDGTSFPGTVYLRSSDQTGIYFHDTTGSGGTATYLFGIKQVGDTTATDTLFDISAYKTDGTVKNTGIKINGSGGVKIHNASLRTVSSSNCIYDDIGGTGMSHSNNGVEYDETETKTWSALCPIPAPLDSNIVVDGITLVFNNSDVNCEWDGYTFYHNLLSSTGGGTTVQTKTNDTITVTDPETETFSTDITLSSDVVAMFRLSPNNNGGGNCDNLYFKGYMITYNAVSGEDLISPLDWSE